MKVIAFVGPSGTGKSYRSVMVSQKYGADAIIDDGLLISHGKVIAGTSAKKEPTKIASVKHALFMRSYQAADIKRSLKKHNIKCLMILGTSDGMVDKIARNIGVGKIEYTIRIEDVATDDEIKMAKRMRTVEGKHVIPVPTFEIKKDFSGYLLDPLQIFKSKGAGQKPYIAEKSIIRPTFSYLGNFTISDSVFKGIVEYLATKIPSIYKVIRTRINNSGEGVDIYMEVSVVYGFNVIEGLNEFKQRAKREIENLTAMNVTGIEVIAKNIHVPEEKE